MVIKTYFDKCNTIISGKSVNTAKNQIVELFYGGKEPNNHHSRHIFHFDETKLVELHNTTFPDINKLKHTLKFTNTGSLNTNLVKYITSKGSERTNSFDLILFKIDQPWDEGSGYDYDQYFTEFGEISYMTKPSNWFNATTLNTWDDAPGIYSGTPTIIGEQHFNLGNEDISIDITAVMNEIILSGNNYGFGLAFKSEYENLTTDIQQYVGFFSRHTQTFFEPHIETIYSEIIKDDRLNFYLDKSNKLYLYVNINSEPTNLDVLPTVTIVDNNGDTVLLGPQSGVTHVTKGIYSVEFTILGNQYQDCVGFIDIWSNLKINGIELSDVEMNFVVKKNKNYYNIGNNELLPIKYGFSVHGIKMGEKIVRGDIRKIIVSTRIPYTTNVNVVTDKLKYRLYVKEGNNELTVINYQNVNQAFNVNYFLIDTESLIPNEYYLDLLSESNREINTIKGVISFEIVSQSEFKI
jgi:hypothetical protein